MLLLNRMAVDQRGCGCVRCGESSFVIEEVYRKLELVYEVSNTPLIDKNYRVVQRRSEPNAGMSFCSSLILAF